MPAPNRPRRAAPSALLLIAACLAPLAAADLDAGLADRILRQSRQATEEDRQAAANAAAAASGPRASAALVHLAGDPRHAVAAVALDALANLAGAMAKLAEHPDPLTRARALGRLAISEPAAAAAALPRQLKDSSALVRRNALAVLAAEEPVRAQVAEVGWAAVARLASDRDLGVLVQYAELCAVAGRDDLAKAVCARLADLPGSALSRLAEILPATRQGPILVKELGKLLSARQPLVRAEAAEAFGLAAGDEAVPVLLRLLAATTSPAESPVRAAIADAIGWAAPSDTALRAQAEQALVRIVTTDRWWGARQAAGWALARIGSRAAGPALVSVLGKDQGELHLDLLEQITGERFIEQKSWKSWAQGPGRDAAPIAPPAERSTQLQIFQRTDPTVGIAIALLLNGDGRGRDVSADGSRESRTPTQSMLAETWRMVASLQPGTRFAVLQRSGAQSDLLPPGRATWWRKARLRDALEQTFSGISTEGFMQVDGESLPAALDLPLTDAVFWMVTGEPVVDATTDPARLVRAVTDRNRRWPEGKRLHTLRPWTAAGLATADPAAEKTMAEIAKENGGTFQTIK